MNRTVQITAAAEALAGAALADPTGETLADPLAYARVVNRRPEGWTLETAGAQDHTIRHEGVRFTDAELRRVAALAQERARA